MEKKLVKPTAPHCYWARKEDEYMGPLWRTRCKKDFYFEEGTPAESGYRWCPWCGREIQYHA